jgi:hypothetical protein
MIRARVHGKTEDKICHFYSGLRNEIQDIVHCQKYNIVNRLFQLTMLAKIEFQDYQLMKTKTSFMPHLASTTPFRTKDF